MECAGEKNILSSCRQEIECLRANLEQERAGANNERVRMQLRIDHLVSLLLRQIDTQSV